MDGQHTSPDSGTPDPQPPTGAAGGGPRDTPDFVRKGKDDGPKQGRRRTAERILDMPVQRSPDEVLAASMKDYRKNVQNLPPDWNLVRRPGQLPNPECPPDDPEQTYGTYNAEGLFVVGRPDPIQDAAAYRRWRAAHPYADPECKGLTRQKRELSLRGRISKLFESDAQSLRFVVDVAQQMGLTEDQIRCARVADIYIMAALVHAMRGKAPYFAELNNRVEGRTPVTVQDNRADLPAVMQVIQETLAEYPELAQKIEQRIATLGNKMEVVVDFNTGGVG